jgi:hypothetical protein
VVVALAAFFYLHDFSDLDRRSQSIEYSRIRLEDIELQHEA